VTTIPSPGTTDPAQQARAVHYGLLQLGLKSPLQPAVEMLTRVEKVGVARTFGIGEARAARVKIADDIARGKREFGEDVLREWEATSLWVAEENGIAPTATWVGEAVGRAGKAAAAGVFLAQAATIFDTVAAAARVEVEALEQLPPAPDTLWAAADQLRTLAAIEGHEGTLSVLTRVDQRFWQAQRIAEVVRDGAGHGVPPDAAPRSSFTYRNWRLVMDDENHGIMTPTHSLLRLWRATTRDWQPGVWKASEVDEPTAQERTFASRLKRFGSAVGTG
jgi:hypothetical protein